MFYKIGWVCCMALIRILYSFRVEGRENVPRGKGYMLVANHRTNFDPIFVAAGVHSQIFYMAKTELFQGRFVGWVLRNLGAFPVERGTGDSSAIDRAEEIVRTGGILGMFPEGTRSPDGTPGRPKSGAAMIAQQTRSDLLPCAICFGEKLGFRTRVTVRYGKLIPFEELGFTEGASSPREIKAASRRMMDEIILLLEAGA